MSDDETQVEQSAEEAAEVEEETTDEAAEENESSEQAAEGEEAEGEQPDELAKARKVAEDQRKRAEKAEAKLRKLEPKPQTDRTDGQDLSALEQQVVSLRADVVRANLAAAGIRHPDDQKYVIEAAKRLGVEPGEAANDEIVAAKLERMRAARDTKDATPAPNRRGASTGTSDVARLADKVEKGGALPSDPALAEKVQQEIARRAQERA